MGGIHPREGWDFRGTTIKVVFPHMGGIHPRGWEFPWFWFAWYFGIFIPRLQVVDTGRLGEVVNAKRSLPPEPVLVVGNAK